MLGISISLLSGDNSILKKAGDVKELTGISQEKETIALAYNSALAKKVSNGDSTEVTSKDMNEELKNQGATADGSNPIKVTFKDSKRQYTINTNGVIEDAGTREQNYQWIIISDNDNDGVISIGDEVAPLIDSVKDEHFYVLANNGNNVRLITKLSVDNVTNSQSSLATGVTYDNAYCDLDGVEHDWLMPDGTIKGYEVVSYDEYGGEIMGPVYYDENETGKVHCTGTYTKNYGLRLKNAGLELMEFSDTGCSYIALPNCSDFGVFASDDGNLGRSDELGNRIIWINYFYVKSDRWEGKVPFIWNGEDNRHLEGGLWYKSNVTLSLVIQVDINLINMSKD